MSGKKVELPSSWKVVSLGEVADVFNGKTPSKKEQRSSGRPILKIRDVDGNGNLTKNFASFVDEEFFSKFSDKKLIVGDSIVLNAAHSSSYVGTKKAYINTLQEDTIPTGEWTVIRSKATEFDNKFKHFLLNEGNTSLRISQIVRGIHLYPRDLKKLQIPLPPIEIQKKIVAILEKTEQLKRWRRAADALTDEYLKSVFVKMFGDPVKNPMEWPVKKLKDVGETNSGFTLNQKRREKDYNLFPYLRVANVFRNRLDLTDMKHIHVDDSEIDRYLLKEGDVLIVEGHGNIHEIGRASVWDGSVLNCLHQNHIIRVRLNPNMMAPYYLSYFLNMYGNHGYFTSKSSTTSGLNTISTNKVRRATIPCPSLPLQNKFAGIVRATETIRTQQQHAARRIDELFDALMQKAFRGS